MTSKEHNNRAGFRLHQTAFLESETEDKIKIYLIRMVFQTSPFLKKIFSRDINFTMKIGAKPSEIAQGLRKMADVLEQNIPDEPPAIIPVAGTKTPAA